MAATYTHLRVRKNGVHVPGITDQLVFGDLINIEAAKEVVPEKSLRAIDDRIRESGNNFSVLEAGTMKGGEFVPLDLGQPLDRDEGTEERWAKTRKRMPRTFP